MSNLNLIIDSSTSPKLVSDIVKLKPKKILLFEINENLIFKKELFKKISYSCSIKEIDLNNKKILSSIKLKNKYVEFIGKLSTLKVDVDKKISLMNFLKMHNISYWWLTTIAEKNPLKRDTYVKINTLYNLIVNIKIFEFKSIFIDIKDRELSSAIVNNLNNTYVILKNKKPYPNIIYHIYAIFNAVILLFKLIGRSFLCKILYKKNNILNNSYPFTLLSSLSLNYSKNHKNPYFQTLIDEMIEENIKYKDLFMLNGFGVFKNISELNYLKSGATDDYDLLDRYIRLPDIFILLRRYLCLSSKLFKVKNILRSNLCFEGIDIYHLLIGDIYISMIGQQAIENLYGDILFKQYFIKNKTTSKYLYPMEMQAWEKILNSHKNIINKNIVSYGIQHVPVPFLMLNYFYSKKEVNDTYTSKCIPLPDKALLFSEEDYQLFKKMGWEKDKISNFGSIRFHNFNNTKESRWSKKDNTVAIILPANRKQCIEFIKYIKPIISYLKELKFYISSHPESDNFSNQITRELTQLDNCHNSKTNINELMEKSKILISYGTSAILGGIIKNCCILIPVLSSSLPLDPAFNKIYNIKFMIDQEIMIKEIDMVMKLNQEPNYVKNLFTIKEKYINLENQMMYLDKLKLTN